MGGPVPAPFLWRAAPIRLGGTHGRSRPVGHQQMLNWNWGYVTVPDPQEQVGFTHTPMAGMAAYCSPAEHLSRRGYPDGHPSRNDEQLREVQVAMAAEDGRTYGDLL